MTLEQQRAIAIARARMRAAQAGAQQQSAPNPLSAFGLAQPALGMPGNLDTNRTAPPDAGPPPQSDLSYRLGRAGDLVNNVVRATASGVPVLGGLADKAAGPSESFDQFKADHPVMSQALPIAGGVASMAPAMAVAPAAFGLTQASLPLQMAASGATGAAMGTGDTAVRGGTGADIARGGIIGAGTGALGPAAGRAVGHFFGQRAARQMGRTTAENRAASNAAYATARASGITVAPQAYQRFVQGLLTTVRREGFDPGIQQNLGPAFDRIAQLSMQRGGITLDDLDHLRQIITNAGNSNAMNASQGRIAGIMRDALDDFVDHMPVNVPPGGQNGVAALREARDLWNRTRKGELIESIRQQALDKVGANYTSAGMQTALRQLFRGLSATYHKNPRSSPLRFFSPEERAVVQSIVRGSPAQNALRWLGKFAPTSPLATLISAGIGSNLGYLAGSTLGAGGGLAGVGLGGIAGGALMSAAMGARGASTGMTRRNVNLLESLVSGGQPASQAYAQGTLTGPIVQRLIQATGIPTLPRLATPVDGLPPKP